MNYFVKRQVVTDFFCENHRQIRKLPYRLLKEKRVKVFTL